MQQSIRFRRGVSRLADAGPEAPYDLSNARVEPMGEVAALRAGSSSTIAHGAKPWIVWDGQRLTGLRGAQTHAGLLYGLADTRIEVFPANYANSVKETVLPHITSVRLSGLKEVKKSKPNDKSIEEIVSWQGVSQGATVSYILIPMNERDEAGPWFRYSFSTPKAGYLPTGLVFGKRAATGLLANVLNFRTAITSFYFDIPTFEITASSRTSYIEVYRTTERFVDIYTLAEWNAVRGFLNIGQPGGRPNSSVEGGENSAFFYVGRTNVAAGFDGTMAKVEMTDPRWLPDPASLAAYPDLFGGFLDALELPTLTRPMNIYGQAYAYNAIGHKGTGVLEDTLTAAEPPGLTAGTLFDNGGTMLYGDVTWATKPPVANIFSKGQDGVARHDVQCRYEYRLSDGVRYGPVADFPNCSRLDIAYQGEQALLVYVNTGTTGAPVYRLFQRLVTDGLGRYVMAMGNEADLTSDSAVVAVGRSNLTFDADLYTALHPTKKAQGAVITNHPTVANQLIPEAASIREKNVVFLANTNRPLEVTFDQFYLGGPEAILAITASRQAEEDALKAYDLYLFTERSVHLARRQGRDVFTEPLTTTVGLKTTLWNGVTHPVVCATREGVAFAGTDQKVYHLMGRQVERGDLTIETPGLWTTVYDLGYDPKRDELLCATNTGLWIYSFLMRGWTGKYDGLYNYVGYDPHQGFAIMQQPGANRRYDGLGDYLSGSVTTQPIGDMSSAYRIADLLVDFDEGLRTGTVNLVAGNTSVVVNGNGRFTQDDVKKRMVIAGNSAALVEITGVTLPHEAFVDPPPAQTVSNAVALWPAIQVTHAIRGGQFSPPTNVNTFTMLPRYRAYPNRLIGAGHQFTFSGFRNFRQADFRIETP
jgi:hypothetical protein